MSPLPRPATAASYHAWHVVIASLAVAAVVGCVYVGQHGWELAEFDFDRPGDAEGWVARGGISALEVREGRLAIVPATRDPLLVFPARFPARSVGWVRLRIRFVADAEVAAAVGAGDYEALHHELTLAWTRTDGTAESEASVSATALFDGSYHDCDLPVRSHDAWRGEIGSLVLDALDARAPRVRIEVDRIALLGHRPTPAGSFPVLLTLAALWALTAWLIVGRPSRPGARLRSGLARTLVACLAPATVLFVAEAVLNMLSFERPFESPVVQVLVNEAEDPTYRDLFRYDPRCLFTQRPGVEYRRGEPINSLGLRGRLPARDRTPGTPRVATFGDSSTFGLALPLDETYSARLGVALGAETLNGGVIGSTVVQGRAVFENLVRPYRPDVVTLAYGAFNEHYPTVLSDVERLELNKRLPRAVYEGRRFLLGHLKCAQLAGSWFTRDFAPSAGWETRQVPRVSAAEFAAALRGFVDSARAAGACVVLLSFPRRAQVERDYPELAEYTAGIEGVAAELGVPLVDLRGEFRALPDAGEALFLDGTHLNAQGNARVAERLVGPIRACLAGRGGVTS